MRDHDDDQYQPYGALDIFDEGTSRVLQWCVEHWRASVAVLAGTPVLVGIAIGFIAGRYLG